MCIYTRLKTRRWTFRLRCTRSTRSTNPRHHPYFHHALLVSDQDLTAGSRNWPSWFHHFWKAPSAAAFRCRLCCCCWLLHVPDSDSIASATHSQSLQHRYALPTARTFSTLLDTLTFFGFKITNSGAAINSAVSYRSNPPTL